MEIPINVRRRKEVPMNTAVSRGTTGQAKVGPPLGRKSSQSRNKKASENWPMETVRSEPGIAVILHLLKEGAVFS
jgi:hypothetical protein